jgi:hypothetical protein
MKTLKLINNRLNWLSAGFAIAFIFIAWLEDDKKENKTKLTPAEGKLLGDYEKATSMNDLYNHYLAKQKEKSNA